MKLHPKRKELEEQIQKAFALVPYPGDNNLVVGDVERDWELQEIVRRLRGKRWEELLRELMHLQGAEFYFYHCVYTFLSVEAFCFYLPAFLITSIDYQRADIVADYLLSKLTPPTEAEKPYIEQVFKDRIEKLSPEQYASVATFIGYLQKHYPERFAEGDANLDLIRFWSSGVQATRG